MFVCDLNDTTLVSVDITLCYRTRYRTSVAVSISSDFIDFQFLKKAEASLYRTHP